MGTQHAALSVSPRTIRPFTTRMGIAAAAPSGRGAALFSRRQGDRPPSRSSRPPAILWSLALFFLPLSSPRRLLVLTAEMIPRSDLLLARLESSCFCGSGWRRRIDMVDCFGLAADAHRVLSPHGRCGQLVWRVLTSFFFSSCVFWNHSLEETELAVQNSSGS
jgi:hypothetical protein